MGMKKKGFFYQLLWFEKGLSFFSIIRSTWMPTTIPTVKGKKIFFFGFALFPRTRSFFFNLFVCLVPHAPDFLHTPMHTVRTLKHAFIDANGCIVLIFSPPKKKRWPFLSQVLGVWQLERVGESLEDATLCRRSSGT